jgi:integral membrane protein (TIGR01906 family)
MVTSGNAKTEHGLLRAGLVVARVILAICVPLLIISSTVSVYTSSVQLYQYGFAKYNISNVTGFNQTQLTEIARQMVKYYDGAAASPQVTVTKNGRQMQVYSDKELTHLADVNGIIQLFKVLLLISIILFVLLGALIYLKRGIRDLLRQIRIGGIVTASFTGILVAWALIDFNSLFLLFHLASFSNNLWILDPAKDYLIMMFPEGFFNDAAMFIVLTILVEAVIIWVLGFFLGKSLGSTKGATT